MASLQVFLSFLLRSPNALSRAQIPSSFFPFFLMETFFIANEQPHKDARLQGGILIEPCAIVPGAEKISNRCNIE